MRSLTTHQYNGRDVEGLEFKIDKNIADLVELLRSYHARDEKLDFGRKAQYLTLDIITDVALGDAFGFVKADSDIYGYIKQTEDSLKIFTVLTVYPKIIKLFRSPLLSSLLPSEKDTIGFGRLMGIGNKIVSQRFGPDAIARKDMLGSFIAHGLTKDECQAELLLQV